MPDVLADPAITVSFVVSMDQTNLGAFQSCEGLGCEVTVEQRESGGNNGFVYQLPGPLRYTNIRLTRPVDSQSATIAQMFAGMASGVTRSTMTIQAMAANGDVVCTWQLQEAFPVRWTGPSLNVGSPGVATETLEIAHHGFLPLSH
jgi:phage tail-like protein